MRVLTYKCDQCKKARSDDANHWVIATIKQRTRQTWVLGMGPWDEADAANPEAIHLCGAKCAHAYLDCYLEKIRTGNSQHGATNGIDKGRALR